jgi:hypothetical protein
MDKMTSPLRVPIPVLALFAIDIGFGVAYLLIYLTAQPTFLTPLLNLDGESNLPTWYSSVQWFCVAGLLAISSIRNFSFSQKRSWLLLALPVVFLGLSLDEVAMIHERIGGWSDGFLPGGSRANTLFIKTGIWMFLLGVPFAAFVAGLMISIRTYFRRTPGALVKLCLGLAVTLVGAVGIETLSNFTTRGSAYAMLQVLTEEVCELLGSTIILWGSYELLAEHRFEIKIDRVEIDGS